MDYQTFPATSIRNLAILIFVLIMVSCQNIKTTHWMNSNYHFAVIEGDSIFKLYKRVGPLIPIEGKIKNDTLIFDDLYYFEKIHLNYYTDSLRLHHIEGDKLLLDYTFNKFLHMQECYNSSWTKVIISFKSCPDCEAYKNVEIYNDQKVIKADNKASLMSEVPDSSWQKLSRELCAFNQCPDFKEFERTESHVYYEIASDESTYSASTFPNMFPNLIYFLTDELDHLDFKELEEFKVF